MYIYPLYLLMGKIKQAAETAVLRTGNTVATPLRRWGEVGNALANILRQSKSSAKNAGEVGKQTVDALVDNFLNFSKVEGKRYQRFLKGTVNLASAVTRRPAMIAGAGVVSGLNQSARQPFKKLLYTPGKMFKGMRNATRIFSKKKGFDFTQYDTHETGGDTRVNKARETRFGFFGKGWASEKKVEEKKVEPKPEPKIEKKEVEKKEVVKKPEVKGNTTGTVSSEWMKKMEQEKNDAAADAILAEHRYGPGPKFGSVPEKKAPDKPKNIVELKEKNKKESSAKDALELEQRHWKNQDPKFQTEYKKEYTKMLDGKLTKDGVIQRGKKHNKGNTPEEIISKLQEENNIEFASFLQDEVLKKIA